MTTPYGNVPKNIMSLKSFNQKFWNIPESFLETVITFDFFIEKNSRLRVGKEKWIYCHGLKFHTDLIVTAGCGLIITLKKN